MGQLWLGNLPKRGMLSDGKLLALTTLERPTDARGGGALESWATPKARDWKGSGPTIIRKDGRSRMDQLDYMTEQSHFGLPDQTTPKGGSTSSESDQTSPQPSQKKLSASFEEWLMGLPIGWVSCEPLATASYRQWWHSFSEE